MKLAFTGDICFINISRYTADPFHGIRDKLSRLNCVVNLEAVFLPADHVAQPVKDKLCLRQDDEHIGCLKSINPYLVNLSNNHINDYGDAGSLHTMELLRSQQIAFFGAGYPHEDHNVYPVPEHKLAFFSYTTRSSDESGALLFESDAVMGPKEFSFDLITAQMQRFPDYRKIVLFHWGIEDYNYPLPEQRDIAWKLLHSGVDLIIGNHSHVIQSYERINGRWVFYTLGHFLFPHFAFSEGHARHAVVHSRERKVSLVPVFNLSASEIVLDDIHTVRMDGKFNLRLTPETIRHNRFLFRDMKLYRRRYQAHVFTKKLRNLPLKPFQKLGKGIFLHRHRKRIDNG